MRGRTRLAFPLACAALALAARGCAATVRVAVCQMRAEDGRIDETLARAADFVQRAKAAGADLCVFRERMDVRFADIVKPLGTVRLAFPIPGPTGWGAIARKHGVWISAALLEGAEDLVGRRVGDGDYRKRRDKPA